MSANIANHLFRGGGQGQMKDFWCPKHSAILVPSPLLSVWFEVSEGLSQSFHPNAIFCIMLFSGSWGAAFNPQKLTVFRLLSGDRETVASVLF